MMRAIICMALAWFLALLPTPFLTGVFGLFLYYGGFILFVWIPVGIAIAIALSCYAAFRKIARIEEPTSDATETCCRRCGYILRGISEPRCSECGERI